MQSQSKKKLKRELKKDKSADLNSETNLFLQGLTFLGAKFLNNHGKRKDE